MEYVCFIMAAFFAVLAAVFAFLKGRAAILISGFNDLTKEERKCYDTAKLAKDVRNFMLLLTLDMAIGAVLCHFVSQYFSAAAFLVFLILFFRNVHMDSDKAFGKYKIK